MANHVFGGFTSVPWESPTKEFERTYADKSAFLFSISNKINRPQIFRIKQTDFQETQELQHAVFHSKDCGPAFGQHLGRRNEKHAWLYDIYVCEENSHMHFGPDYDVPDDLISGSIHGGNGIHFQIMEIEVFQIC